MRDIEALRVRFSYDEVTGVVTRLSTGKPFGSRNSKGYLIGLAAPGFTVSAHRLAFALVTGRWPLLVDHVNGEKADNRWLNLRESTPAANQLNRHTGHKGVRVERSGRWTARLKGAHLGTFDTEERAVQVYQSALREAKKHAFGASP